MNTPSKSKINWTSLIQILIGMAVVGGLVPEQYEEGLLQLTVILAPSLVMVFRTWFTG